MRASEDPVSKVLSAIVPSGTEEGDIGASVDGLAHAALDT